MIGLIRSAITVVQRLTLALTLFSAASAWGQNAISAHSGMIHYVEGRVLLDGQPVEPKATEFPEVKKDQTLATEEGRAEVLLTPGVFLRLSEDSSFRMISNQLSDTSFEVVSGDALIEVMDLLKDNAIAVQFKGGTASVAKRGLYRFDADKGNLRVYEGEIGVTFGDQNIVARKGKEVKVGDGIQAANFDPKDTDPFYRWAERRSEYIATANVSAARQAGSMGLLSSAGSWAYNPYYGMFTYLPGTGYGYSPFGWAFYSPLTVGNYYAYNYGNYGGYYNNVGLGTRTPSSPPAIAQRGVDTASSSAVSSSVGRSTSSGSGMSVASHASVGGGHK
jgi:FecR protein